MVDHRMPLISNVLVSIDLSEGSGAVLEYGQMLAAGCGGTSQVLYVLEGPHLEPGNVALWDFSLPALVERLERAAEKRLAEFVAGLAQPGIGVELVTRVGNPAVEITKCAGERRADPIVIGTHGRSGVAHALLGSVAEKVIRTAPCPVVTVRSGGM